MADLITLNELRDFLGIPIPEVEPTPATAEDNNLQIAISAASAAVRKACNRSFEAQTATPEARVFRVTRQGEQIEVDDFFTTTGLVIAYQLSTDDPNVFSTISDELYWTRPSNAASMGMPWTSIKFDSATYIPLGDTLAQVTATWGWPEVPAAIKQATLIQAARFFKRKDAPFGIAGSSDMSSELRLLNRLDPDVELLCNQYKRWWV